MNKNKYGKNGKGSGSAAGKKTHGGGPSGDSVVPEEELISWYKADADVFEAAAKDKAPLVLYFMDEGVDAMDGSRDVHDEELAKMSEGNFLFVLIDYNPDRTPSLDDGCPVPTSKLLSPNPSRDYGITRYPTFLVCDWFGNEYTRYTKVPQSKDLKKRLDGLTNEMDKLNETLTASLDAAQKAIEGKDLRDFFKAAVKNFRTGVVGLSGQEDTIALYRKVIDDAREEVSSILEDRPDDGKDRLKKMSKDYKDTELYSDIKDALDILKG